MNHRLSELIFFLAGASLSLVNFVFKAPKTDNHFAPDAVQKELRLSVVDLASINHLDMNLLDFARNKAVSPLLQRRSFYTVTLANRGTRVLRALANTTKLEKSAISLEELARIPVQE